MSFGRDTDIGKSKLSDVDTNQRLEALLEFILGQEIDQPSVFPDSDKEQVVP